MGLFSNLIFVLNSEWLMAIKARSTFIYLDFYQRFASMALNKVRSLNKLMACRQIKELS
jgi:hypothetical protein